VLNISEVETQPLNDDGSEEEESIEEEENEEEEESNGEDEKEVDSSIVKRKTESTDTRTFGLQDWPQAAGVINVEELIQKTEEANRKYAPNVFYQSYRVFFMTDSFYDAQRILFAVAATLDKSLTSHCL